jgi:hypothetical protein
MFANPYQSRRDKMHELIGLSAGSPIGFMASLGMMRILAVDRQQEVRLGWQNGHAVIDGIAVEAAIAELTVNMGNRSEASEFNWADTPRKVSPEQYRAACKTMINDERALGFMAGWATDAAVYNKAVRVTRLDMTSGNQKLLRDLRKLATKIKKVHFESALKGGPYENQSSYGLDPIAVRSHAHEPKAPTKSKPPGKPGLIWLAFESIPLHPVVPIDSNKSYTTGWRMGSDPGYVWPIWDGLLTLDELFLLRTMPVDSLYDRYDINEIWFSRYGSSGKYGMLLPAQRER